MSDPQRVRFVTRTADLPSTHADKLEQLVSVTGASREVASAALDQAGGVLRVAMAALQTQRARGGV